VSFFELFQPGLKYLREEKDRQKMLVSKPTHGGGAPLGIDLEGGTAKISITRPAAAPEEESAESPGSEPAAASPPTDDELSPPASM
jgi:hypothetical protein